MQKSNTDTKNASDGNFMRDLELSSIDPVPDDLPVSIGVSITEEEISPRTIGKLEVALVTTDAVRLSTGSPPPFSPKLSEEETPGVALLKPSSQEFIDRVDNKRWTPDRSADTPWGWNTTLYENELESNRALTGELYLWDDYQYEGYFPTGTYRFSESYKINDMQEGWGFSVSVSRPE